MRIQVALPTRNLQHLAFWVAHDGGLFARAGLDLCLIIAAEPLDAPLALVQGKADMAVLPPPLYQRLIADRRPVKICANLLANDPLNIVVSPAVARQARLGPCLSTADALCKLRGLRIGVSPGPRERLADLLAWAGLAPGEFEVVRAEGRHQDRAFASGEVDALYAHTPHLERAIVDSGGVLAAHLSAGDVEPTRVAQVHAVVCSAALVDRAPDAVAGMVSVLGEVEQEIAADPRRAIDVLAGSDTAGLTRQHMRCTLSIYAAAMPASPVVTCAGLRDAERFRETGAGLAHMSDAELEGFVWTPPGN